MKQHGLKLSILGVFITLFFVSGAFAETVVYKGPRAKKVMDLEKKADTSSKEPELEEMEYTYDPRGKTDPFKSFIAEQEEVEEQEHQKPRTYLETLDLSQLELIAIVLSRQENWAMVKDAKGLGYVIKKGTPIGLKNGVVHEIKDNKVIVREKRKDYLGRERIEFVEKVLVSEKGP